MKLTDENIRNIMRLLNAFNSAKFIIQIYKNFPGAVWIYDNNHALFLQLSSKVINNVIFKDNI
jgi:hypothetical protein